MARKKNGDAILEDVKAQVKSEEGSKKAPQAPQARTTQSQKPAVLSSTSQKDTEYNEFKVQLEELRRELREKSHKDKQDLRAPSRVRIPGEDLLEVETLPRTFRRKLKVKKLERSKSFTSWLFSNREL